MIRQICLIPAILIIVLMATAPRSGAKSIFDDDWVPPKPADAPRPTTAKPPTPPATDPAKPADPSATPPKPAVSVPAPATPTAARRAVPTKSEQSAVRKVLKEVFAEQLVDRSIPARRKLTEALLTQVDKTAEAPVDQFVLLAASIDAGVEAASLPLAFQAADRMAAAFEVDGLAIKVDTATKFTPRPGATGSAAENVQAGLALADQLIEADDLAAASRVYSSLLSVAAADPALRTEVVKRQRDLAAARDASEKVARHLEKLKTSPDDPVANLEIGKYLCFTKYDWAAGLPALARGSDAVLKALAAKELAGVQSADAQSALADGWWDLAQSTAAPAKASLQAHAGEWYAKAAPELKGLVKVKAEKRLAEAAKAAVPTGSKVAKAPVNLLKQVDPARDAVKGKWQLGPTGLTCDNQPEARIAMPYEAPDEYDYHVAFTRNESTSTVHVMFGRNGNVASLAFWGDKFNWGINCVDGKWRGGNQTTGHNETPFKNGQRYDCVVRVRKDSVTALLDGAQLFTLKTDFSNVKEFATWELRGARLGVAAHQNSATFHVIEITEVGAAAKSISPTPTAGAQKEPAEAWVVLFRSNNPAIWNTDKRRGPNDFAVKVDAAAPKDTKWLRLTCGANGKSVIIPITAEALTVSSGVSPGLGWDGTAFFAAGASHLGIWNEKMGLDRPGVIAVGRAGHDYRGWGFGRQHQVGKVQGYSWEGEELKGPVAYEIAVKAGALTDTEQKAVLSAP